MASTIASILAGSRPSEKFGTHSTSVLGMARRITGGGWVRQLRRECTEVPESQKFSTTQALLLNVEIVKARFLPSGEANGTPRIELVVHNSETSPFKPTRRIVAACTDELATNQPFPSADQLIPERCFEPPKVTKREDPLLS